MLVNVYAGHNPDGKIGSGEVGLISESTEARKIKDYLIPFLRSQGYQTADCTCENATSKDEVEDIIIKNCNNEAAFTIGIHFDPTPGTGTSIIVPVKTSTSNLHLIYENILRRFKYDGFQNNGTIYPYANKEAENINNLLIVNVCHLNNEDDVKRYSARESAAAICNGITDAFGSFPVNNLYSVKVVAPKTFIRKSPGLNSAIAKDPRNNKNIAKYRGEKLGIIEARNGWGLLKSGEGWINLMQTIRSS